MTREEKIKESLLKINMKYGTALKLMDDREIVDVPPKSIEVVTETAEQGYARWLDIVKQNRII